MLFDMKDIKSLGGFFIKNKIVKRKKDKTIFEGTLSLGKDFERTVAAKAVFFDDGKGYVLSIASIKELHAAYTYFMSKLKKSCILQKRLVMRIDEKIGKISSAFLLLSVIAFLAMSLFIFMLNQFTGSVPDQLLYTTIRTAIIFIVALTTRGMTLCFSSLMFEPLCTTLEIEFCTFGDDIAADCPEDHEEFDDDEYYDDDDDIF